MITTGSGSDYIKIMLYNIMVYLVPAPPEACLGVWGSVPADARLNSLSKGLWYLQPMIPPKRFDISPLTGGCSEGLDVFRFFFKIRLNGSDSIPKCDLD